MEGGARGIGNARVVQIVKKTPKLVRLNVIQNATQNGVTGAKNWATLPSDAGDVIVEVTTDPNNESAWLKVRWTGEIGGGMPGKPNRRKVSRSAAGKFHVQADLGGVSDYVDIWVIQADVIELEFQSGFPLTSWSTKGAVTGPEWKKAGNPDKPVCYAKGSNTLKLAPKLKLTPNLGTTVQVALKATSVKPAVEFRKIDVPLNGPEVTVRDIAVSKGALEDKVKIASLQLAWSISIDAGATWTPAGSSGAHKVYQVSAAPLELPTYDFALEKACGYVNGDADVADKINKGIPRELRYDPADYQGGHPLTFYAAGKCLCWNNADLMRYLCRSIGVDGSLVFTWGGRAIDEVIFYLGNSGVRGSFQVIAGAKDATVANPHFTYHVQTQVGGNVYDPSYGNIGLVVFVEQAPTAVQQLGAGWPPVNQLDLDPAAWMCPH